MKVSAAMQRLLDLMAEQPDRPMVQVSQKFIDELNEFGEIRSREELKLKKVCHMNILDKFKWTILGKIPEINFARVEKEFDRFQKLCENAMRGTLCANEQCPNLRMYGVDQEGIWGHKGAFVKSKYCSPRCASVTRVRRYRSNGGRAAITEVMSDRGTLQK